MADDSDDSLETVKAPLNKDGSVKLKIKKVHKTLPQLSFTNNNFWYATSSHHDAQENVMDREQVASPQSSSKLDLTNKAVGSKDVIESVHNTVQNEQSESVAATTFPNEASPTLNGEPIVAQLDKSLDQKEEEGEYRTGNLKDMFVLPSKAGMKTVFYDETNVIICFPSTFYQESLIRALNALQDPTDILTAVDDKNVLHSSISEEINSSLIINKVADTSQGSDVGLSKVNWSDEMCIETEELAKDKTLQLTNEAPTSSRDEDWPTKVLASELLVAKALKERNRRKYLRLHSSPGDAILQLDGLFGSDKILKGTTGGDLHKALEVEEEAPEKKDPSKPSCSDNLLPAVQAVSVLAVVKRSLKVEPLKQAVQDTFKAEGIKDVFKENVRMDILGPAVKDSIKATGLSTALKDVFKVEDLTKAINKSIHLKELWVGVKQSLKLDKLGHALKESLKAEGLGTFLKEKLETEKNRLKKTKDYKDGQHTKTKTDKFVQLEIQNESTTIIGKCPIKTEEPIKEMLISLEKQEQKDIQQLGIKAEQRSGCHNLEEPIKEMLISLEKQEQQLGIKAEQISGYHKIQSKVSLKSMSDNHMNIRKMCSKPQENHQVMGSVVKIQNDTRIHARMQEGLSIPATEDHTPPKNLDTSVKITENGNIVMLRDLIDNNVHVLHKADIKQTFYDIPDISALTKNVKEAFMKGYIQLRFSKNDKSHTESDKTKLRINNLPLHQTERPYCIRERMKRDEMKSRNILNRKPKCVIPEHRREFCLIIRTMSQEVKCEGPDCGPELTGISKYLNSQTTRGRANVSMLTLSCLAVALIYYKTGRKKPKAEPSKP